MDEQKMMMMVMMRRMLVMRVGEKRCAVDDPSNKHSMHVGMNLN